MRPLFLTRWNKYIESRAVSDMGIGTKMTPSTVSIRQCQPGDELALSILGKATFLEAFAGVLPGHDILLHCKKQHAREKYAAWLRDSTATIWLAEIAPARAPVGYLVLASPDLPLADISSQDAEIKRIYLLHPFQGAGLGGRLMTEARDYAKNRGFRRLLLGVYVHNAAAIGFYEKIGYRRLGRRDFKIGGKLCDDLILGLTLGD